MTVAAPWENPSARHLPCSARAGAVQGAAAQGHAASPLLVPAEGEGRACYLRRLAAAIDRSLFTPAHRFDRDGIYLYKRPVHSAQAAALADGGSVFHHCVVYVKSGEQLCSLEYGPSISMDVTAQPLTEEAPCNPVLSSSASPPEPSCLPMLHIGMEHRPLESERVQQALRFAEGRRYHALLNNCLGFADFVVRVLTGGRVKNAPLIFDCLVGEVPPQDCPRLGAFFAAAQLTWFQICDGSHVAAAFHRADSLEGEDL